ncbi:MAG: VWA domain-containing protein [Hyphomicrobiales bacterium]
MPITQFPESTRNVSERMTGFMEHLRYNGINVGVAETEAALLSMRHINLANINETRLALKSVCANDADRFDRFDELFKAYWMNKGRDRRRDQHTMKAVEKKSRRTNKSLFEQASDTRSAGEQDLPDDNREGESAQSGEGKLIASKIDNINKTDLREFMKPEDLSRAEKVAEDLAKAIRYRRSRRRRAARKGAQLDLRKITRKSVSTGGEPLHLLRRHKPDKPQNIIALLDVSGSMTVYSRIFLAFLKGLMSADQNTDAYLFHTQLVRISDALRDGDTFRAVNRLSMMAQGFGGGTKIGTNLGHFNRQYAAQQVNGRSVVIILSDGYDNDPPEKIANELARLKKRGCKVIWLNPLKGWKDYEPVAKGMAAALPHLDLFAAATTLNDLAALEPELGRI